MVDRVCTDLKIFLHDHDLDEFVFNILLGVRETLINAVAHGAQEDPALEVHLLARSDEDSLLIRVRDPGPGFDWRKQLCTPVEVEKIPMAKIAERGRGLCILMSYFDSISFNEKGNEIELHISLPNARQQQMSES